MTKGSTNPSKFGRLANRGVLLLGLISVFFCSISLAGLESDRSSDLVFCPLQKQWVKRLEPGKIVLPAPLTDICAPKKDKTVFLEKLLGSFRSKFGNYQTTNIGGLFLSYKVKGDRAFSEMPSSPPEPKAPFSFVEKVLSGTVANRFGHIATIVQIVSLEQLSRPPTQTSEALFSPVFLRDLETFSTSTSPRGPPIA